MDLDLLWYRGDSVDRSGRDTGGRIDGLWTLDSGLWILDTGYWKVAKDLLRLGEKGCEVELGDASGAWYWCQQKKGLRVVLHSCCATRCRWLKVDVFEHRRPSSLFWSSRADQRAVDLT